jgi:hypothetical protein
MCLLQQAHVYLCDSLAAAATMAAERGPDQLYALSGNVMLPELRLFYHNPSFIYPCCVTRLALNSCFFAFV